ncbi:NAD(P)/FAD-dependent oxidoreductase [Nocardioides sediminis]|uniref:NAD(P)/FAD-dependent oxidoreductase n=1 Tax=Nocardioides sediminis TaxID=433648 RepID=UPI000D3032FE|nr:NAD(P)/FAD-dependent oxidoreductase [Nocardioides sediminis]
MTDYDVVVVGGRVAGASTALLLARAGARVALVDRGRRCSDTVSTHALMRAGVLQLSRWGLLDRLVAAGTPPVCRTTFHHEGRRPVEVSIRPSTGVDALYAPRRHVLDTILVDAAAEAGAEVLHQTHVTALLRDGHGRVTGVVARATDGRRVPITAPVTVGADGISSMVARAVDAPVEVQGRAASAVLYRYVPGCGASGYEWAYGGRAAAGVIPTNGGECCVFVSSTPERVRRLRRQGAEAAFDALLGIVGGAVAENVRDRGRPGGRIRGWAGTPGHVRRSWGPGWALVGDAGYFKDPITTHGMTDALRDAELLTDALLAVLDGSAEAVALADYQATRDRLSRDLFEVTEEVAAYEWHADRVQVLLRRVSSAMRAEVDLLEARVPRPAPWSAAGAGAPCSAEAPELGGHHS